MRIFYSPLLFVFSLLFFSCETNLPPQQIMCHGGADFDAVFAKFSLDKNFQNAHPSPSKKQFTHAGDTLQFPTPDGKIGRGYLVPSEGKSDEYLLLFHEWWGLNDYIKNEADFWSKKLNINVLALDLYDGKVAENAEQAGKFMRETNNDRAQNIIRGAMEYAGETATFRTMGWCFGGGWSLKAALLGGEKIRACVVFYGMPVDDVEQLSALQTDVLFIHPDRDRWITLEVVERFKSNMEAAGKTVTIETFEADHAFANPSSPRYDAPSAEKARELVLAYLSNK